MAGRFGDAQFARVAEPPMALYVGFAEMLKAGVMSYLCAPSRRPRFHECTLGTMPNGVAMGERDMFSELRSRRTGFLPG